MWYPPRDLPIFLVDLPPGFRVAESLWDSGKFHFSNSEKARKFTLRNIEKTSVRKFPLQNIGNTDAFENSYETLVLPMICLTCVFLENLPKQRRDLPDMMDIIIKSNVLQVSCTKHWKNNVFCSAPLENPIFSKVSCTKYYTHQCLSEFFTNHWFLIVWPMMSMISMFPGILPKQRRDVQVS